MSTSTTDLELESNSSKSKSSYSSSSSTEKGGSKKNKIILFLALLAIVGLGFDVYQITSNMIYVYKNEYVDLAYFTKNFTDIKESQYFKPNNTENFHVIKKQVIFDQISDKNFTGKIQQVKVEWTKIKSSCGNYYNSTNPNLIIRNSPLTRPIAQFFLFIGFLVFVLVNLISISIDLIPKIRKIFGKISKKKSKISLFPCCCRNFKIKVKNRYSIILIKSFTLWIISASLLPLKGIEYEEDCAESGISRFDIQELSNLYNYFTASLLCSFLFIWLGNKYGVKKMKSETNTKKQYKWTTQLFYYLYYLGWVYLISFFLIGVILGAWMAFGSTIDFNYASIPTTFTKVSHDILLFH